MRRIHGRCWGPSTNPLLLPVAGEAPRCSHSLNRVRSPLPAQRFKRFVDKRYQGSRQAPPHACAGAGMNISIATRPPPLSEYGAKRHPVRRIESQTSNSYRRREFRRCSGCRGRTAPAGGVYGARSPVSPDTSPSSGPRGGHGLAPGSRPARAETGELSSQAQHPPFEAPADAELGAWLGAWPTRRSRWQSLPGPGDLRTCVLVN